MHLQAKSCSSLIPLRLIPPKRDGKVWVSRSFQLPGLVSFRTDTLPLNRRNLLLSSRKGDLTVVHIVWELVVQPSFRTTTLLDVGVRARSRLPCECYPGVGECGVYMGCVLYSVVWSHISCAITLRHKYFEFLLLTFCTPNSHVSRGLLTPVRRKSSRTRWGFWARTPQVLSQSRVYLVWSTVGDSGGMGLPLGVFTWARGVT